MVKNQLFSFHYRSHEKVSHCHDIVSKCFVYIPHIVYMKVATTYKPSLQSLCSYAGSHPICYSLSSTVNVSSQKIDIRLFSSSFTTTIGYLSFAEVSDFSIFKHYLFFIFEKLISSPLGYSAHTPGSFSMSLY